MWSAVLCHVRDVPQLRYPHLQREHMQKTFQVGQSLVKCENCVTKVENNEKVENNYLFSFVTCMNRFRLDVRKFTFSNRVVDTQNSLPELHVNSATINCFKKHFSVVLEPNYKLKLSFTIVGYLYMARACAMSIII